MCYDKLPCNDVHACMCQLLPGTAHLVRKSQNEKKNLELCLMTLSMKAGIKADE